MNLTDKQFFLLLAAAVGLGVFIVRKGGEAAGAVADAAIDITWNDGRGNPIYNTVTNDGLYNPFAWFTGLDEHQERLLNDPDYLAAYLADQQREETKL